MARVVVKHLERHAALAETLREALRKQGYLVDSPDGAGGRARKCQIILWSDDGEADARGSLERDMFDALADDELVLAIVDRRAKLPFGFRDFKPANLAKWDGTVDASAFRDLTVKIDEILNRAAFSLTGPAKAMIASARRAAMIVGLASIAVTGGLAYQAVEAFEVLNVAEIVDVTGLAAVGQDAARTIDEYSALGAEIAAAEQDLAEAADTVAEACSSDRPEALTQSANEQCDQATMAHDLLRERRRVLLEQDADLARRQATLAELVATREAMEQQRREAQEALAHIKAETETACQPTTETTIDPGCDAAKQKAEKLRTEHENAVASQQAQSQSQPGPNDNQNANTPDGDSGTGAKILAALVLAAMDQRAREAEAERDRLCAPQTRSTYSDQCTAARARETAATDRLRSIEEEIAQLNKTAGSFGDLDAERARIADQLSDLGRSVETAAADQAEKCDRDRLNQRLAEQSEQCAFSERTMQAAQARVSDLGRAAQGLGGAGARRPSNGSDNRRGRV